MRLALGLAFLFFSYVGHTPAQDDAGWQSLFNGKNTKGWKYRGGESSAKRSKWQIVGDVKIDPKMGKRFVFTPGEGILLNGDDGRGVDLLLDMTHGDCELHVEFMVAQQSNSGVYLQGQYEVQILDSYGKNKESLKYGDCGGIYNTSPPMINASLPAGQWQTFDIQFQAPKFDADGKKIANAKFLKVYHNGKLVQENVEVKSPTNASLGGAERPQGTLMLQGDHGPVAFRNLKMRPLVSKE